MPTRLRLVVLLLAAIAVSSTASAGKAKLTLQQLLTHSTIRVGDLRLLDLKVKSGHGPLLWAAVDETTEVQFWVQPGVAAALGVAKIRLITTGKKGDENHGTIIWPREKIGRDFGQELKALYKTQ
jgi:hypothetical protein